MYFGSVKFFKHLIYSILIIVLLAAIALLIVLIYRFINIDNNIAPINNSVIITEDSSIPEPKTIDDICDEINELNLPTKQIIDALEENTIIGIDEIYKKHYSVGDSDLDYIDEYPDLYVTPPSEFTMAENTVYLTFDDGPSENTMDVLNILDKYNIKATFFISGNEREGSKAILQEVVDRGHTVGIHSYLHKYDVIYKSVDDFLEDFNNTYNYVYECTGVKPNIYRFPGGSINAYNTLVYKQIIAEITRRGFVYYDWNASGEDASSEATWTSIYNNALNSSKDKSRIILLLHDASTKDTTVTVLEDIIIELQNQGYTFDKLTHNVKPITFGYNE